MKHVAHDDGADDFRVDLAGFQGSSGCNFLQVGGREFSQLPTVRAKRCPFRSNDEHILDN